MNLMGNSILFNSEYYLLWKNYTHLKETSIISYSAQFKKFELYLELCGYTGKLDFDNFYFYKESNDYSPIDAEFFDGYIEYLKENNASKHTLYDNIVYLRNFFRFLKSIKAIKRDPIAHYKNPYRERKLIDRSLSENEANYLLKGATQLDPFFRQYYVLILLMLTTGLRNSEVTNLTFDQIDFERKLIYVDKGQKTTANTVFMTNRLISELKRYLSHPVFKKWISDGNELLFFNNNQKLDVPKLNAILNKIAIASGIKKHITAHTLRHTMAYLMQKNGVSISIIQRQLRHVNLSTTLRYLPPLAFDKNGNTK